MTTPKIERLIEAVKYFAGSAENQIKPTTKPVTLKQAKAALLELAQSAEDWKSPLPHRWGPPHHVTEKKSRANA